ncbi:MAG: hypothetical protein EOO90_16930 [Pedobacter sp.]|nr:MAG: hypothetical protein EOO90_16930 [Pedobacter sp.]
MNYTDPYGLFEQGKDPKPSKDDEGIPLKPVEVFGPSRGGGNLPAWQWIWNPIGDYGYTDPFEGGGSGGGGGGGSKDKVHQLKEVVIKGKRRGLADRVYGAYHVYVEMAGAAGDFIKNYSDMREANFQATQRGSGGKFFAEHFSNLREAWDQSVKGYPRSDSRLDQLANEYGRDMAALFMPDAFREALNVYRPANLPLKYKYETNMSF